MICQRKSGFGFAAAAMMLVACATPMWLGSLAGAQMPAEVTAVRSLETPTTTPFRFTCSDPQWPVVAAKRPCELRVQIDSLSDFAGRRLSLVYELVRVTDGVVVAREQTDVTLDAEGSSDFIALASTSPEQSGVYEIRCRLVDVSEGPWYRFGRQSTEHALVKTPWLIVDDSQPSQTPQFQWSEARSVQRTDPDAWQTPTWIPGSASRLVPSVRRVSETLTPWHDGSGKRHHTLKAGESFVGWIDHLAAHQPHRFTISFQRSEGNATTLPIEVAWSDSPTFETVWQRSDLKAAAPLDLASSVTAGEFGFEFLHFPRRDAEFVRITNVSTDRELVISGATVQSVRAGQSDEEVVQDNRDTELSVLSNRWAIDLVDDFQQDESLRTFAGTTRALYLSWLSLQRLHSVADLARCNQVRIPVGTGITKLIRHLAAVNQIDGDQLARLERSAAVAATQWSAGSLSVRIIDQDSRSSETDVAEALEFLSMTDRSVIDCVRWCGTLVDRSRAPSGLQANQLPLWFDTQLLSLIDRTRSIGVAAPTQRVADRDALGRVRLFEASVATAGEAAHTQVTIVNDNPWAIEVVLSFAASPGIECEVLANEGAVPLARDPAGSGGGERSHRFSITVPANSINAVRTKCLGSPAALQSWQARPSNGVVTQERIKSAVARVVGKIGTLAMPVDSKVLHNGGFEMEGKVGIVGWMHTQFPESAVVVDAAEAIQGQRSIRMTNSEKSAGRTWLVSEPIRVPRSGRLAVAMATRAGVRAASPPPQRDQPDDTSIKPLPPPPPIIKTAYTQPAERPTKMESTHRVRVSLEGNYQGRPLRLANEFSVPCNGQWQTRRVVLETEKIPLDEIDTLRLTIDSLSPGRLWIDDVQLYDEFATAAERASLEGKAFLAVQGLQQGELVAVADLLNNRWSRSLLIPLDGGVFRSDASGEGGMSAGDMMQARAAHGDAERRTIEQAPSKEPKGSTGRRESVADRIREWLPRPIRF